MTVGIICYLLSPGKFSILDAVEGLDSLFRRPGPYAPNTRWRAVTRTTTVKDIQQNFNILHSLRESIYFIFLDDINSRFIPVFQQGHRTTISGLHRDMKLFLFFETKHRLLVLVMIKTINILSNENVHYLKLLQIFVYCCLLPNYIKNCIEMPLCYFLLFQ